MDGLVILMLRRGVVVVSGIALMASGVVGLAAPATGTTHQPHAVSAQARAWVNTASAASLRAAHGAGVRLVPDANSNQVAELSELVPAGHLGGRKDPVVLDVRETKIIGDGTIGVTARAGRTGAALWSTTVPGALFAGVTILVEPLGTQGTPGVLIEQFTSAQNGSLSDEDLTLTALSGVNGSVLWSHPFDGVYDPSTEESSEIAAGASPIHAAPHKAIDVLVPVETSLGGGDQQTQGFLVSGVDGTTAEFAGSYTANGSFPTETAVPDLNRDGFGDVIVDVPNSFFQAVNGGGTDAGAQFWTSDIAVNGPSEVSAIRDYANKNVPNVAIETFISGEDHSTFRVLSGVSGNVLWTRKADDLLLIHKAGPKLTPAVMLASTSEGNANNTISETWHYEAVTPANTVLYSKHITATVKSPGTDELFANIFPTGDVNGDGSVDVLATLDTGSDVIIVATPGAGAAPKPVVHAKDGLINGRNGDFHSLIFQSNADGSLQKGTRTDLLATEALKGNTRLVGLDGKSRKAYYTRTIPTLRGKTASAWSFGIRVSGHSCSDIALDASTKGPKQEAITPDVASFRGEEAILTARGDRLWTITFPVKDVTGGTLTHFKKPKHFCV